MKKERYKVRNKGRNRQTLKDAHHHNRNRIFKAWKKFKFEHPWNWIWESKFKREMIKFKKIRNVTTIIKLKMIIIMKSDKRMW